METKVMKIMWTVAALAGSVTMVNAQQTPRRVTPPAPPAPATTPAPAQVAPRAERPDPLLAPGIDWLLDPPGAMTPFAPGQMAITPFPPLPSLPPMAMEPPPLTPLPGQMSLGFDVPMAPPAIEVPSTPRPGQWMFPIETPMAPLPEFPPVPPSPIEPMLWTVPQGQGQGGPTTPRPPATRRPTRDVELERVLSEVDRAEAARRRELDMQDRQIQREIEQQIREVAAQDRAVQRQVEQQLAQIRREAEQQDRNLQRQIEQQLAQARRDFDMHDRAIQREQDRIAQQLIRDTEMQERIATREMEHAVRSAQAAARADVAINTTRPYGWTPADARVTVPAPWVPQDVADSAWQAARELFNRGEYGQAAQAFRALPTRYPNSAYASEAAYYQAFSLFRIGGTTELREALAALEASKTKYPNARSRTEAANLTTRIQGALARRGDQQAAAALTRTGEAGVTCDREEQSVQAEAMNQLSRMEGSNVNELITRVLARKDECAIPLRRTAVFLVGNRRDAQAIGILAGVARNDPSVDVKVEAIQVIGRLPNEEGVPVLEELAKNDDERVQRAAVRALVRHPSARARTSVRNLVESDNVSERVRSEALSSFDAERATQEDVAWLRALYGKVTTPTLKARTLSAIVRIGGPEVDQWLATIARDETQPSEIRATAMRRIGESMSIPDLGRLYDSATQRRFRAEIITVLGKRKEDAATDKLIDIIKNGTDPQLRTSAISAVANKNDARAQQLLLEIINK